MKKALRAMLALMLAATCVFIIGTGMRDSKLKASEDNGNETAVEQQETKKEAAKPVEVSVPEKKEEPKAEEKKEAPKAEEPKAEEKKEEPKAEEPKAEEKKEEPKAEEPKAEEKTEEPAVEEPKAEEPAAEEEPAETAVAEAPKAEVTEEKKVNVTVRLMNKGEIRYGDKIELRADAEGNCDFTLQWQVKEDKEWKDISGATGDTYTFIITEENESNDYRVVAITK